MVCGNVVAWCFLVKARWRSGVQKRCALTMGHIRSPVPYLSFKNRWWWVVRIVEEEGFLEYVEREMEWVGECKYFLWRFVFEVGAELKF